MRFDLRSPQGQLQLGYGLVPIVAGLDKFTGVLADWDQYLSPAARRALPMSSRTFMRLVGVVEVAAGVLVLARPRLGGYVVAGWLGAITANLLATGDYFDIAARDALLALSAVSLARMAAERTAARRELPAVEHAPEYYAPVRAEPVEQPQHIQ